MEEDLNDSLPGFDVPDQLVESSFEDDTPRQLDSVNIQTVIDYQVIEDGLQKGKEKLADSHGYMYTIKAQRANGNKVWRCSVQNKSVWCKATVLQKANGFTQGSQPHAHSAQLGAAASVKQIAANEIFTSVAEIVNKVPIDFILCSNITQNVHQSTIKFSF